MVLGKLWWCGRILARNGVCTPTGETKHSGKKSKSKWDKFNKNQQRRDWPPDCLPSHEVILNCHLFFYKILLKKKKCQNHPNIYFFLQYWVMGNGHPNSNAPVQPKLHSTYDYSQTTYVCFLWHVQKVENHLYLTFSQVKFFKILMLIVAFM